MQIKTSAISLNAKIPLLNGYPQSYKTHEKAKFKSKLIHSSNKARQQLLVSSKVNIKTFDSTETDSINGSKNTNYIAEPGSKILVAGSTGGVGQLTTKRLLEKGYIVYALARNLEHAKSILNEHQNLNIIAGDLRDEELAKEITRGVDAICCCIGTTAFPTTRWKDNNGAESTFKIAVSNLIKNTPSDIKRFVLVSTVGVKRYHMLPYSILNLFNAITYKKMSEDELINSNVPYTILRPSRLTDAPYTSYDLNTLFKGESGDRLKIVMSMNDDLSGETSRISVAEAIVQCLMIPETVGNAYSLENVQGDGPDQDVNKWQELFSM